MGSLRHEWDKGTSFWIHKFPVKSSNHPLRGHWFLTRYTRNDSYNFLNSRSNSPSYFAVSLFDNFGLQLLSQKNIGDVPENKIIYSTSKSPKESSTTLETKQEQNRPNHQIHLFSFWLSISVSMWPTENQSFPSTGSITHRVPRPAPLQRQCLRHSGQWASAFWVDGQMVATMPPPPPPACS